MMQSVIPILRQVIGNAENQNSPEKRDPSKNVVFFREKNRKNRQAEPGKEGSEDELGDSEACKIKRLLISVPPFAVKAERELDNTQNDDEGHEPIAMSM